MSEKNLFFWSFVDGVIRRAGNGSSLFYFLTFLQIFRHDNRFESNAMFCEIDIPQYLMDHLQQVADFVVCDYSLVRMNATGQEYVQYMEDNHPYDPIFLVSTASELFMCYGITDEESVGVPMTLRFLATYSKDRKLRYDDIWSIWSGLTDIHIP